MRLRESDVLVRVERLTAARLRACVREAWVCPACDEAGPLFDDADIARLQLICDLIEDFLVNDEAVPIILSLVDQVHGLRREVRAVDRALREQDARIRKGILDRIDALRDTTAS